MRRPPAAAALLFVAAFGGAAATASGQTGHALRLDGLAQEVVSHENFDVQQLTVEAWVNVTSVTVSPCCTFAGLAAWGRNSDAAWETMLVGVPAGGPVTHVYPYQAFSWNKPDQVTMHSPDALIPLGEWAHIAFTYDGETGRHYINGELVDQQQLDVAITPAGTGAWLSIGNNFPGSSEYLGGDLDEVRLWSVARTEAQIKNFMNRKLLGNHPGLLAYYRLDEGEGLTVADSSGNGLHAQLGTTGKPGPDVPEWVDSTAPVTKGADLNGDGAVDVADLLQLLSGWGPCPPPAKGECPADLNGSGAVDVMDLLLLLSDWG